MKHAFEGKEINMNSTIVYQMSPEDLEKFFNVNLAKREVDNFLSRFRNVLVTVQDIANIHQVTTKTVYNYINEGILIPEFREKEQEVYKFRLEEVLKYDFKAMRKQIKLNRKTT